MEKFEYTIKATKITSVDQMNNVLATNLGKKVIPLIKTVEKDTFQPCLVMAIQNPQDGWSLDWEFYHVPVGLTHDNDCYYHLVNNIITPKE